MQSKTKIDSYDKVMNRVCDYIYENLDEDLSVEHLSLFAGFSKYQFGGSKMDKKQQAKQLDVSVDIVNFVETKIAVFEHRGAPELVNESASKFIAWRKKTGLSPATKSQTFGLIYEDPKSVPADKFRFDIAGSVLHEVPDNASGIINKTIPAGRCAVIRHLGSHDDLYQSR